MKGLRLIVPNSWVGEGSNECAIRRVTLSVKQIGNISETFPFAIANRILSFHNLSIKIAKVSSPRKYFVCLFTSRKLLNKLAYVAASFSTDNNLSCLFT